MKLKRLPFYDIHGELLQPTALVAQGSSRFQEAQFQFLLSPSQVPNFEDFDWIDDTIPFQATDIASNRDIRMGSKLDYLYQVLSYHHFSHVTDSLSPSQVQLRFCPLDPSAEQGDEFPPSICVQVKIFLLSCTSSILRCASRYT